MENSQTLTDSPSTDIAGLPGFCRGLAALRDRQEGWDRYDCKPAVSASTGRLDRLDDTAAYQTMLAADALRFLTLQMTAAKASGHPGGFASSAEAVASLVMLGCKNIVTEVGHHAPGYYSVAFLDRSLEAMGIGSVGELCERYREQKGLFGHITPAIPGLVAPAGPLGQGQHFAMALALLNPGTLVPLTIGDGGIGEPYVMSGMLHFLTAYPSVTNFLPVLVWNGYSQEHHSMCSTWSDERMIGYFQAHGFEAVEIADAAPFDDAGQGGRFVDNTLFSLPARLAFTRRVLEVLDRCGRKALSGVPSAVILKQLKGSGVHEHGSKSHNLTGVHTLQNPLIIGTLQRRALSVEAWRLVRANFERAGGGPASRRALTERERPLPEVGPLPLTDLAIGSSQVPTRAFGELVAAVGKADPAFVMTNADGNEASGMMNINRALGIRFPVRDDLYEQRAGGQVYEPLSEDACAGLTAAIALFGGRALWCSYESFAVNGLPVWQTVTQALGEIRRRSPSAVALFTAGALEQGRNGWTHQRPEVEGYLAVMMRGGSVYPLFPLDANMIQAAYQWALEQSNKGIAIFASKNPLPVLTSLEQGREAVSKGALVLAERDGAPTVVLAVVGDIVVKAALEAAETLHARGIGTRVVAVVNPRRLYRPGDVAWKEAAEPDGQFLADEQFAALFGGEALLGVTGGAPGMLEPVLLRKGAACCDVLGWKRGDTTADAAGLLRLNGLTAADISARAMDLAGRAKKRG